MSHRNHKRRRREARPPAAGADHQPARGGSRLRWIAGTLAGVAAIALVVGLVLSGRDDNATVAAPAAAAPASTHGVPPQIAANRAHANQVIDGSLRDTLRRLKGMPVVVNQWASWCPNCRQEFAFFQRLARTYGHRGAFVGLDSNDRRGAAQAFLRSFPVPYPSLYDPGAEQARAIGGGQGWPTTFYYDRTGRETYVRVGGYTTLATLEADIRRYALGEAS
jgi:thiol-disulfide isomerase/thioredoxin